MRILKRLYYRAYIALVKRSIAAWGGVISHDPAEAVIIGLEQEQRRYVLEKLERSYDNL